MTKTSKFKLILDDYPVRTIEQLQEHFEIEDILKYFENELLLRWLHVRGYEKQYESVKRIDKSLEKKEIVKELLKIFEIDNLDESNIGKIIELHLNLDKEKELNTNKEKNVCPPPHNIQEYFLEYDRLITHMEENKDSLSVLKRDAILMEQKYLELFKANNHDIYYRLLNTAPKAIYAILTRDALKKVWLDERDNIEIYTNMQSSILTGIKAKKILGKDLKVVNEDTDGVTYYKDRVSLMISRGFGNNISNEKWYPVESFGKKLMVISIEQGVFVRNAGAYSEKLTDVDVNNKLLLFNGLEYQCDRNYFEVLYMEV